MVTNVTVSDVSWDSFLLSWSAEDGAFEAFLIEVTDAETGAEWQNHTVPADARSLAISGLSPTTWYRANLYGLYRGALLDPVFADTITGINAVNAEGSLFPLLPSSSAEHSEFISVFQLSNGVCLFIELWCSCSALSLSVTLTLIGVETLVRVCFYTVRLKLALLIFPCPSKNVSLNNLPATTEVDFKSVQEKKVIQEK